MSLVKVQTLLLDENVADEYLEEPSEEEFLPLKTAQWRRRFVQKVCVWGGDRGSQHKGLRTRFHGDSPFFRRKMRIRRLLVKSEPGC